MSPSGPPLTSGRGRRGVRNWAPRRPGSAAIDDSATERRAGVFHPSRGVLLGYVSRPWGLPGESCPYVEGRHHHCVPNGHRRLWRDVVLATILLGGALGGGIALARLLRPLHVGIAVAAIAVAAALMGWRHGASRAKHPVNRTPRMPMSYGWAVAGLTVVVAVAAVTTWALLRIADQAPSDVAPAVRVQAISTGLGMGGGVGAAVLLGLAFRRQWMQEHAQVRSERDAKERLVTDLYAKAIDQLGSDHPEVRLAAMFSLQRLVTIEPDVRQMVADVICAYLRMPRGADDEFLDGSPSRRRDDLAIEREVHRSAQEILSAMLRPDHDTARSAGASPVNLNLRNATLVEFDLVEGYLGSCDFRGARFVGQTRFERTRIAGAADFTGATYEGPVALDGMTIRGPASFQGCRFLSSASFAEARFHDHVVFTEASFVGPAVFTLADLGPSFTFAGARFDMAVDFSLARASMLRPSVPPEGWETWRSGSDPQTVLFVRLPPDRGRPKSRANAVPRPARLPQARPARPRSRR